MEIFLQAKIFLKNHFEKAEIFMLYIQHAEQCKQTCLIKPVSCRTQPLLSDKLLLKHVVW